MNYTTWSFRNADAIVNSKSDRRREICGVLGQLPSKHPVDKLHNLTRNYLESKGWNKEELVSPALTKRQSFDNYRDRIAVEIEFSRYEFVYRDYFRFLLAYNEDKIDVGVLIVFTKNTRIHYRPLLCT